MRMYSSGIAKVYPIQLISVMSGYEESVSKKSSESRSTFYQKVCLIANDNVYESVTSGQLVFH